MQMNPALNWMVASLTALGAAAAQAAIDPSLRSRLDAIPAPFVRNVGQWDAQAAFASQLFAATLFVTRDGQLVYQLPGRVPDVAAPAGTAVGAAGTRGRQGGAARSATAGPGWVLTETLVDADGAPRPAAPAGGEPLTGTVSYLRGGAKARTTAGISTHERLHLGEVYPGIDVQLRATGRNVEKIFTVGPQVDPGAIRVTVGGAQALEVGAGGELIAHTGNGPVAYTAPIAFQDDGRGGRIGVQVRYALDAGSGSYGFALGPYDRERPLVIDPLLQSSYAGGSSDTDYFNRIAIHPVTGDVYAAGTTSSADFPKVAGGARPAKTAGGFFEFDAVVVRFNAALTSRLQATYMGGNGDDGARGLAIHPQNGDIYLCGSTQSTNLPGVTGSEQTGFGGGQYDVYVARMNPGLTTLVQTTYLGGNGDDLCYGLAIHPASGDIYVVGTTTSTDLPKATGGARATPVGQTDGFVTRLNAGLTSRLQSTYLGGTGEDYALALAIHPQGGEVYVAGYSYSSDLIGAAGGAQTGRSGAADGFVTRLSTSLTTLGQTTYLGGTSASEDVIGALAIHPASGEVYVSGYAYSTDFPGTAGGAQSVHPSPVASQAGYVSRFTASLTKLIQSTYFGGTGNTRVTALAIHPASGDVIASGFTSSPDLPGVSGGVQTAIGSAGILDSFVVRFNAALSQRVQATYLGGAESDDAASTIAIHPLTGDVYVAGSTNSVAFPGVTGSEQTTLAGLSDAVISRLTADLRSLDSTPNAFAFEPKLNVPPGSQQTAGPVQVSGFISAPISIAGGNFAQFCIANSATCASCAVPYGTLNSTVGNQQYVCIRQTAPFETPGLAKATLVIGGATADFIVTTGNQLAGGCTLDIDGNGAIDALTDGLMILRAMFGLTGTSVTNAAVGNGATRSIWADLRTYLNGNCGAAFAP